MKPGVTGIGGIFFKSEDPKKLTEWYKEHLNFQTDEQGYVNFTWRESRDPDKKGLTVWSPFPKDTEYFSPRDNPYMINYRVHKLDKLLAQLREAGVEVDEKMIKFMSAYGIHMIRYSLGVVFIWFGLLKVAAVSPVADLVAKIVYWAPPNFFVPFLGVWEVSVGLGLLFGVASNSFSFLAPAKRRLSGAGA